MGAATVLVVDCDPEILDLTTAMLARSSYDVLTADSAAAALNVLRSTPNVDLVISDTVLAGGSAGELIRSVQQSFPATAVMLTTTYTAEALDPAIPCLEKPFTMDTLIKRVHEVLERTKKTAEHLNDALCRTNQSIVHSRELIRELRDATREVQSSVRRSRQMRWERNLQQSEAQKPTVLVVEDDVGFRYAVSHFLSRAGFTVLDAANHDEALRLWRDHHDRINVLVTDLDGVDGLQLAEEVESDCPEKPIVVMTGDATVLRYPTMRKPFELDDLVTVLLRLLGRD